jgi:hypothetical protein
MRPRAACLLQIDASVFSKPMGLGKLALFLSAALVRDYLVQPGVCLSNRLLYYKIQDALRVVLCRVLRTPLLAGCQEEETIPDPAAGGRDLCSRTRHVPRRWSDWCPARRRGTFSDYDAPCTTGIYYA